ncbi:MAG: transmembrane(s)protein [candidate division WS6 bacterium 34_10]|uniref:Transmembrane(S)protein n=1 Tax=candidate division WS6 bacterium 34_10 TaxID=1641389 RepID=A0A101HI44_9BACT|nr:MAG: transmembrane(s)protein [candidate division WS6 bacterium 34_10]
MNRNNLVIILSVVLLMLGVSTVFVFKARGSNERELVSGCVPYNVSISRGGEYQAVIEWSTEEDCLSYVMYGDDRNNLEYIAIDHQKISAKTHRVVIDKLLPSQIYYLLIYSGKNSYGNNGLPLSFSLSSL